MFEEADSPDNFAFFNNSDLATVFSGYEVTWIANHLLCLDSFTMTGHSHKFTISICDNGFDGFVQHVSTTVDGAQPGERLRKLAETIKRVDVR